MSPDCSRLLLQRGCDVNSAWRYGLALTMSTAMSVRALCFLCGSSGKHEVAIQGHR
ncbi:hypothetical protein DPMN_194363 [Dreissena polymorpha]|uniref:Uncharacterized protein n=1 Tax=Dreissena polymorpha TaxID=45954 RepID=A0A9D3Y3J4_DREPO|nr:hypothetical protein DPMN_194363 [Dreissena polymorpha]